MNPHCICIILYKNYIPFVLLRNIVATNRFQGSLNNTSCTKLYGETEGVKFG